MSNLTIIGDKFKNICFIGLNKVEYFPEHSEDSIFADSWRDVTDEQTRKSLALCFFAPRDLNGEPVDPYLFLGDVEDPDDPEAALMAKQSFAGIPMIDLCRMKDVKPNSLHILVVADVIFHWDMKDSYIQPTSAMSWTRDIQQILKSYPKSTEKIIYTNWDSVKLEAMQLTILPVKEMPLYTEAWLNKPSFQEKYGFPVLATSILMAMFAYFINYQQAKTIDILNNQITQVRTSTPRGQNYEALERAIFEQEDFMRYKALTPMIVKDIASAIQLSGTSIESYEIKNNNPNTPAEQLLVTIKTPKDAYKGWLQEEPIAKALTGQSVTLSAIRKPPGGNALTLEGLIDLNKVQEMVDDYRQEIQPETTSGEISQ